MVYNLFHFNIRDSYDIDISHIYTSVSYRRQILQNARTIMPAPAQ